MIAVRFAFYSGKSEEKSNSLVPGKPEAFDFPFPQEYVFPAAICRTIQESVLKRVTVGKCRNLYFREQRVQPVEIDSTKILHSDRAPEGIDHLAGLVNCWLERVPFSLPEIFLLKRRYMITGSVLSPEEEARVGFLVFRMPP